MHAIGHVAANLSFAAVAISLTHTVKTLEPAFNVVLSQVGCRGPCAHALDAAPLPCRQRRMCGCRPRGSVCALARRPPRTCPALLPAHAPQLVLGVPTPLPVILSLVPIMLGVASASAAELSFNWMGFLTAMLSNLTFGFRAVWSKK